MSNRIVIRPASCIGCRSCVLACSFRRAGAISPRSAAVHVYTAPDGNAIPMMCMHCTEPECVKVCPTGALTRSEETGAVILDRNKCIRCGQCATACTLGNIHRDMFLDVMVKCDQCGGHPRCVDICPAGAIDYIEVTEERDVTTEGKEI